MGVKPNLLFARILGDDISDSNTADENVGLGLLGAAAVESGAYVTIADPIQYDDLVHLVRQSDLNLVGLTAHHQNIRQTLGAAEVIKAEKPDIFVILGGHHVSATANEILTDFKAINAVCIGEGEEVISGLVEQLIDGVELSSGILKPLKVVDLDRIGRPLRRKIGEVTRISTSRGCPFVCNFCTTPFMRSLTDTPSMRVRSSSLVVNDIIQLTKAGARKIYINDDLFVSPNRLSRVRARKIAEGLIANRVSVHLKVQLRVDSFGPSDRPLLTLMRRAGFRSAFIGVESGSNTILAQYNKRTSMDVTEKCIELFRDVRIQVNAGTILASPDSTIEDILDSIQGFQRLRLAYMFFRRTTFRVHIFPGTAIERSLDHEGRLLGHLRYLPRTYEFREPGIKDIVEAYEDLIPQFLTKIGARLFKLRDRLIETIYENPGATEGSEMLEVWSDVAARMLLKHFRSPPTNTELHQDFTRFMDYCYELTDKIKTRITIEQNSAST